MKDRTADGSRQEVANPSGEVFAEYGVVDLNTSFPTEKKHWQPDEPMDAEKEQWDVVPFAVRQRGFKKYRSARQAAERLEDEENGSFKAVQLSDMRGL